MMMMNSKRSVPGILRANISARFEEYAAVDNCVFSA